MKSISEIDKYGNKSWYLNGQLHREDGPAVECANGDKFWWINSLLHRIDGPAAEYADGDKYWYINGKGINCKDNKEFLRIIKLLMFI